MATYVTVLPVGDVGGGGGVAACAAVATAPQVKATAKAAVARLFIHVS
jgi:hypothetical protein